MRPQNLKLTTPQTDRMVLLVIAWAAFLAAMAAPAVTLDPASIPIGPVGAYLAITRPAEDRIWLAAMVTGCIGLISAIGFAAMVAIDRGIGLGFHLPGGIRSRRRPWRAAPR